MFWKWDQHEFCISIVSFKLQDIFICDQSNTNNLSYTNFNKNTNKNSERFTFSNSGTLNTSKKFTAAQIVVYAQTIPQGY
jgi:hypothetical protein